MAITATRAAKTQYRLTYLLTHDGNAGDTITITAANLIDDSSPEMSAFFSINWPSNNQANARKQLLGDNGGSVLTTTPYCTVIFRPRSGLLASPTVVDADVDGTTSTQNELNVTTSGSVAGTIYMDIIYHHSITR